MTHLHTPLYNYWGELSEPHTCEVNEPPSVYNIMYIYVYIIGASLSEPTLVVRHI